MANIVSGEVSRSRSYRRVYLSPVVRKTTPHLAKDASIRAACQSQPPTCVCHRGIIPPSRFAARLNPVTTGNFDFHIPTVNNFLTTSLNVSPSLPLTMPLELRVANISYTQFLFVSEHVDALAAASVGFAKCVRLKYDGPTGTLAIAGPSLAHEIGSQLSAEIHRAIHSDKLDFYGNWKADEAWQIVNSGSKTINLNNGPLRASRAPDGSLQLAAALVPFLVIEVVDTNTTMKELRALAIRYIFGSNTNVRVVILIKLDHKPPKRQKRKRGLSDIKVGFHPPGGAANNPTAATVNAENEAKAEDDKMYTHGSLWVFTYTASSIPTTGELNNMRCAVNDLEFYPTPPPSSLTLTWRDIMSLNLIPAHVADKSVSIPYTVFAQLVVATQCEKENRPYGACGGQ